MVCWLSGSMLELSGEFPASGKIMAAIRGVCREFIVMCRDLKLFSEAIVAIDWSKFKAVNNRDKNFTDQAFCFSASASRRRISAVLIRKQPAHDNGSCQLQIARNL
jgi:hypothetical protein